MSLRKLFQAVVDTDFGIFPVIKSGSAHTFVIKVETKRPDQMKTGARIGAEAYDIAGVGRNLRLVKNNMTYRL